MGKNQAYKSMQRARLGSGSGGPDEVEDGMVDGSFHSPEWHAARLASLKTSHTVTWEEYKKKQKMITVKTKNDSVSFITVNEAWKEDEVKKGELEADKDKMMREYRAQLDAERASKLAQGRNHCSSNSSHKKDRKDRDVKKHSSKKRKHSKRPSESESSSSSRESSSSDEDDRDSKRSKSRSKRRKKETKHRSRSKQSSSSAEADGPLPLSRFFGGTKS